MLNLSINRRVELKSGIEWIKSSFITLRESPLQFIILGVCSTLISLMPALGAFMAPLFLAKFASLTVMVERRETIRLSSIFDGFFTNKTVLRLAFLNFCLNTLLLIVQYIVESGLKSYGIDLAAQSTSIMLAFFIPILLLQVALWLSPVICFFHPDIQPLQAMWLSIKACCFNVVTLFLYSLLVLFFTILAIVPLGLGLLIWLPMLNIVTYFIYKSMFINQ